MIFVTRKALSAFNLKGGIFMKKWVCPVCGYVHEGPEPPEKCPVCKVPGSKFNEVKEDAGFACEHVLGVAADVAEDIKADLRSNFEGECSEVGMYLAMARVADREGYPEVSAAFTKYAFEEAEHAAKFAELLGEVLTDSTKKNLQLRVEAETGACAGKLDLASAPRPPISTPSTTPFTKWRATKPDTARASRVS